jgi:hypothetical protein
VSAQCTIMPITYRDMQNTARGIRGNAALINPVRHLTPNGDWDSCERESDSWLLATLLIRLSLFRTRDTVAGWRILVRGAVGRENGRTARRLDRARP